MLAVAMLLPLHTAFASSVYVLDAILKNSDGKVLAGMYDVRLSLWKKPLPEPTDVRTDPDGHSVLNIHSKSFTGFAEEHVVTSATNGAFSITMGKLVELEPLFEEGTNYLQVDVKPSGTDDGNWQRVILPSTGARGERLAINLEDIRRTRIRFANDLGVYEGILLDKQGKEVRNAMHLARFSLWRSANIDTDFDTLPDGSIRSASSNYLSYQVEIPFETDAYGRFKLNVGPFNSEALPKDTKVYVQLEICQHDDPLTGYDIIDPDGDIATPIDRYTVKDGKLVAEGNATNVSTLGDSEKLLVSNIPGGTTSRYFELGVGDALPVGYYEIRVRQADGKAASLRYNAVEKRWEVSNDGIVFTPIATFLKGTPEKSFIIGLGDAQGDDLLELQFGESLRMGRLSFDPIRELFIVNKSVDFMQKQLINAALHNSATPPPRPVEGQEYYNTSNKIAYYFNGSSWIAMGGGGFISSSGSSGGGGSFTIAPSSGAVNTTVVSSTTLTWEDLDPRNKSYIFANEALSSAMVPATAGTKGTIEELHDDTADKNFYRWTTKQTGMQQMQLMLEWTAPEDFLGFADAPINVMLRTPSNNPADAQVDLVMQKNNINMAMTGATDMTSPSATNWQTSSLAFSGTPTIQPGERVTIIVTLGVTNGMTADIGAVTIHYKGK